MSLVSVDPSTGEELATYELMATDEAEGLLEATHRAQQAWSRASFAQRAGPLARAAALLREGRDEHAALMAREMGKPLEQGRAEVEKCAATCEFYAERAAELLAPDLVATEASRSYVAFRPLGVVLAVMPWNFPYWQVFRFAAPTLAAGNGALLKHAANTTGCALRIEQVFREAGLPEGLFRALRIDHDQVAALIRNPLVSAVTLTGSTEAGRSVAPVAAQALKKTVLELGGSDPYLVLADADLDLAARTCATSRLLNSGQSCIAAKRFVVVEAVREEFTRRFVEQVAARRVGSPFEPGVDLGPLARRDLRDQLHEQVRRSVEAGASVLLGGKCPSGPGAFYPPTVLADVRPGMPAHDEELFGPVAAIIAARDEEDAVRIANATSFGLGAAVFTRDVARGERLAAEQLEAGSCFVNALVKSDPRLPFGGVKASGHGRELGAFGIREFVNVKTVWVA